MGIERAISFINVKTIKTKCQQFVSGEYRFPSVYGFKVLETLSLIPSINYTFVNLKNTLFSVPTIKIVDERHQKVENQIFYDLGSTIKLKCMVENIVGEQPEYIIWKKGDRMLNYDTERGGIRWVGTGDPK